MEEGYEVELLYISQFTFLSLFLFSERHDFTNRLGNVLGHYLLISYVNWAPNIQINARIYHSPGGSIILPTRSDYKNACKIL